MCCCCNQVWIRPTWAGPRAIVNHFKSFLDLLGNGRAMRRLGWLWVCDVCVIWRWRNSVIFSREEWNFRKIEEEIKCSVAKDEGVANLSYVSWSGSKLVSFWNLLLCCKSKWYLWVSSFLIKTSYFLRKKKFKLNNK